MHVLQESGSYRAEAIIYYFGLISTPNFVFCPCSIRIDSVLAIDMPTTVLKDYVSQAG